MSRVNFDAADALVLKSEGGYVNRAGDPGGPTNLGITLATAKAFGLDVDHDGDVDIIDVKNLKPSDAAVVYKAHYWDTVSGDQLPAGLDYATFDYAVNSGPSRAAKALQGIVGVAADGKIGPKTLAAIAQYPIDNLIKQLNAERLAFLRGLSTWAEFGKGWTSRITSEEAVALSWASPAAPPVDVSSGPAVAATSSPSTPKMSALDALVQIILTIIKGFARVPA